jgi:outer membrane protein assembly factor BamB
VARRRLALTALLAAVVAGCAGDDPDRGEERAETPSTTAERPVEAKQAPEAQLRTRVRVVDGDTQRPVRNAVVRIRREAARSNRRGLALVAVPAKRRLLARISAAGYIGRSVRVGFRERRGYGVLLWRRDLQWPQYGATPARTQAHPAIRVRPPFRIVWRRWIRSLLEFPAVVWEGVAYVNTFRGDVVAVSMRNGRVLWRKQVATTFASSPAVDPERRNLVVTSKLPGRVTIVDMRTGRIKWRYDTDLAEPSPLVANGIAYFGDTAGRVYALDLARRRARWVFDDAAKVTSSPALLRRRLYFGDYAGRVFALDARSGRPIWTSSAGSRVYGTVAVGGGRVFAPSVFSGLSAFSARTGALLWRIPMGAFMYSSPAYYRGRVYFGSHAGVVSAANARSGRIIWSRSIGGRVSGAIVVVGGVVYAGSLEGRIRGWTWRTGRRVWSFPQGEYVPVSGNGGRLLMHGRSTLAAVESRRRR